jgi:patatin-like phospholipase/acyl hydrolase
MKKILTLDGGGIFGVGQAAALQALTSYDNIDAIAGTSIGSVVGAMLATGVPPEKLLPLLKDMMPSVFKGHRWRHYMPITPRYKDKNLNKCLQDMCPGSFRDVKIPMFVTAADLDNRGLKVYYSGDTADGLIPLWEILRRAVAAETYFLPWKGMGDGGIYANNPVMVGIAGVCARNDLQPDVLRVCSIGTGRASKNSKVGTTKGWTLFRWGAYIIEALLSGASSTMHEFFAERMDLDDYLRIQFVRQKAWGMDNPSIIDEVLNDWAPLIKLGTPKVKEFFSN